MKWILRHPIRYWKLRRFIKKHEPIWQEQLKKETDRMLSSERAALMMYAEIGLAYGVKESKIDWISIC